MKSTLKITIALALLLLTAAVALAQSGAAGGGAAAGGSATKDDSKAGVSASADANAKASADVDADATLKAIRARAAKVSSKARADADAKLEATEKTVDSDAEKGEDKVANRLATEFKTTAQVMMDEKTKYGTGWGSLMIANTLMANAKGGVTLDQLFALRTSGEGWGQIAAGLGMKLGDAVKAANAGEHVANGMTKPGAVPAIHGDGLHAGLGAGAGAKVGANVGLPKIKVH
jgi:hypothetical protein